MDSWYQTFRVVNDLNKESGSITGNQSTIRCQAGARWITTLLCVKPTVGVAGLIAAGAELIDSNDILRNNSRIRNLPDSLMTDLIELATGKRNDPILMDWAISRYWQMEKRHPQHREAMEQSWFDDLTLRRWLDSDNEDILTRLFVHLPAERFVNLGHTIGEHWGHWSGNLAYHSAPVLAQFQPDFAWKCFA